MAKILVLYYSSYGHVETMAAGIAEVPPLQARMSTCGEPRKRCL